MKVRFGADTSQFKKGVDEGKQAAEQFKKDAGSAFDSFAAAFGVNMGQLREGMNKFTTSLKIFTGSNKSAAASTGILSKSLQLLKTALISTGIGALVVALGSLVAYFTKTQRGADGLKRVMTGFRAVIDVLIDRMSSFGEGVYKIFTGQFKEGWDALKSSVKGVGAEMVQEAKTAYELEKAMQALEDREISLITVQAERRQRIAELRLAAKDEEKTAKERQQALGEAIALERKALADDIAIQNERVRIMQERLNMGESTREDYRQMAEAEAELNTLQRNSANGLRELQSEYNSLGGAIAAETAELEKQTAAIMKQRDELLKLTPEMKPIGLTTNFDMNLETDKLTAWAENQKLVLEDVRQTWIEFGGTFSNAMAGVFGSFAENVGLMLAGTSDIQSFSKLAVGSLGQLAVDAGKIVMQAGIAFFAIGEALRKAITTPAAALAAVAAGAALIAVGKATQASLSNLAGGGTGGNTFGTGGTYDSRGVGLGTPQAKIQALTVNVVGQTQIKNKDIYIAFKNAETNYRLTT